MMETRMISVGPLTYTITCEGQIVKRRGVGFNKLFLDKDGYLKLTVTDREQKTHNRMIHRLVYEAFHGEVPVGMTVDHIDGDKTNNHYSNLQLMTAGDNAVKGNAQSWTFISPSQEVIEVYNLAEFCREHGLHKGHMGSLRTSKRKHHKGWKSYV